MSTIFQKKLRKVIFFYYFIGGKPMNLLNLRKNKGISQQTLADYLNVNQTVISHFETGRNEPDLKTLIKIANFFDCSVDYLIGHQAKNVLYLDSYTPTKIKIIEELKDLTDDESYQLLGYIARMKDIPLSEVLLRKKD